MILSKLAAAAAIGLMSISAIGCSAPATSAEPSVTSSPSPSPSPEGPGSGAPYVVKQTMTLGGETISGVVCSITKPFAVTSKTPKVTFVFHFIPARALSGTFTYKYSIPSAGETHSASGTYTISELKSGTLTLTLKGSDAVAFHGFSGPFPIRYSFDLVPTGTGGCPPTA